MRAFLCLLLLPFAVGAQTVKSDEHSFRVVKLVERLDHPWCVAFLPDGRMLVTERDGRLNLLSKNFERTNVEGVPPVFAEGQGGLFDVALHPDFAKNGIVYLSYAGPGSGGASTELLRAKLNGNRLEDAKVIFRQEPKTRGGVHFGGRIVFDRAGFLY
ncbi:MAG TPA: PQQ-dependent sugar dehydrogenase, partial [Burkholderiales bacterium]|nr:PQQ-dependent sugar dehydrogenase [Burkholderiales bacterium]